MRRMSGRHRRLVLAGLGVLGLLVVAFVALQAIDDGDGFGLIDGEGSSSGQYLAVFAMVLADAIVPIFPGETTLNAASTLAAQGELTLQLVMLAGALGAVVGDSCLYWIARRSASYVQPKLDDAMANEKVATGMQLLGDSAPVLIVGGRYVPGVRFVVNATMGLTGYPYRRFLLWSTIGGVTWSVYTCLLAYWVGTVLADYPLGSIVISGAVTSVFVIAAFVVLRRQRGKLASAASKPDAA
jgi:membrane protein DedA with SNARE-associated domain